MSKLNMLHNVCIYMNNYYFCSKIQLCLEYLSFVNFLRYWVSLTVWLTLVKEIHTIAQFLIFGKTFVTLSGNFPKITWQFIFLKILHVWSLYVDNFDMSLMYYYISLICCNPKFVLGSTSWSHWWSDSKGHHEKNYERIDDKLTCHAVQLYGTRWEACI